jgi:hypothetical protein
MGQFMDWIRNRTRRWLTLAGLAVVAACLLVADRGNGPRDRVSGPNAGAIAPAASPVAPARVVATTAAATRQPAPRRKRSVRRDAAPPASAPAAGRVIAIDPETGQPGPPSPEQLGALRGGTIESLTAEGLVETRLPNGTVILHLDERFHDFVIARVGRNGRVTYGCVFDHGGPERALRDTTAVPALELE